MGVELVRSSKAPIMSRFDLFFILVDEQNEVIDYAIARKIVDLHSHRAEAAKRPYPITEVLKYLQFCKLIKPKMTPEAEELIVQQYWLVAFIFVSFLSRV